MQATNTSRRLPVLVAVAALSAAGLAAWWFRPSAGPGAAGGVGRPVTPVIIYLVDTLRADRLGLYGYAQPTSPHIDALAADSVVFDHAYGPAPWTLPSVASLLTSTFACEHGVVRYRQHLSPAVKTLTERLGPEGYATGAYYSNIHAGAVANLNRGYDVAEERKSSENDRAADVSAFLSARGSEKPFYLYLHTMEPHEPFGVPARFMNRFGFVSVEDRETYRAIWFKLNELKSADWSARRPVGSTDNTAIQQEVFRYLVDHREQVSLLYDAAVSYADDNVGRVVDLLKREGIWDRAIFVLVADHGEELGDHGGWFHDQSVYEELVHVPMIVHFPGDAYGGRRVPEAVSLVDVVPTLFDYLGRPELCDGCRGSSLLPLLAGSASPRTPPGADYVPSLRINEIMYYRPFREGRGDRNVALRRGQWKGIWNADPDRLELFDVAADPAEHTDVSGSHPEIATSMRAFASDWFRSCGASASAPEEVDKLDERTRERLRAMGYFN